MTLSVIKWHDELVALIGYCDNAEQAWEIAQQDCGHWHADILPADFGRLDAALESGESVFLFHCSGSNYSTVKE